MFFHQLCWTSFTQQYDYEWILKRTQHYPSGFKYYYNNNNNTRWYNDAYVYFIAHLAIGFLKLLEPLKTAPSDETQIGIPSKNYFRRLCDPCESPERLWFQHSIFLHSTHLFRPMAKLYTYTIPQFNYLTNLSINNWKNRRK